jgi:hypothetical protein
VERPSSWVRNWERVGSILSLEGVPMMAEEDPASPFQGLTSGGREASSVKTLER